MIRSRAILLAFRGGEISQTEPVREISSGYECWNFNKFDLDSFVEALQTKIPPVNDNVLRNYKAADGRSDYGITERSFKECSWGLFIPDNLDDVIPTTYGEPLFLINLYSPVFLYPLFCASDFGIDRIGSRNIIVRPYQNQSSLFARTEFVAFFKLILPQSQYGALSMDRGKRWNREEWRLFVAAMLFTRLQDYDGGKSSIGWQRESADMGAILESLLTAGDRRARVEHKLRKRSAVLLSHRVPSIDDDIRALYEQRSRFVHGRFFADLAEKFEIDPDNLPIPGFELLRRHRECVRRAIVAYLHLAQVLKSNPEAYPGMKSVIDVLKKASGDSRVAKRVIKDVDEVLALLNT